MAEFPYINGTGRIKDFLRHIQNDGIPSKVTQKHLESLGYKSKNDRGIINVLRHIGFLDGNNVPTELWKSYRNKMEAPKVMANAIRQGYAELYSVYPDAHRKDNEALRNFFSVHTSLGVSAVTSIVQTFKSLSSEANFDEIEDISRISDSSNGGVAASGSEFSNGASVVASAERDRNNVRVSQGNGVTLNVNIEIAVPETTNPEVYDIFFKSLKEHILSNE